jgi:uncharacterized protein (DUF2126 family)
MTDGPHSTEDMWNAKTRHGRGIQIRKRAKMNPWSMLGAKINVTSCESTIYNDTLLSRLQMSIIVALSFQDVMGMC